MPWRLPELVCPAGSLPALRAAVEAGADAVYVGLRDGTNARHFPGLNFTPEALGDAVALAHAHGTQVFLATNTYPNQPRWGEWAAAVDAAAEAGADALIAADVGVLEYACEHWPRMRRHLSVQGSATHPDALAFYHQRFGVRRAVLPRVLSLTQVTRLAADSPLELEVFGFGSLCIMVEGRCLLSSYVTGESPNTRGVCSPARAVRWEETPQGREARLGGVLIDRFADDEPAGYPTLCKGRFEVAGVTRYALEEPTSLNTLELLPQLAAAGIAAVKIEGRQRSPAYVGRVTSVWRAALDRLAAQGTEGFNAAQWQQQLAALAEGKQTTLGAWHRPWQ